MLYYRNLKRNYQLGVISLRKKKEPVIPEIQPKEEAKKKDEKIQSSEFKRDSEFIESLRYPNPKHNKKGKSKATKRLETKKALQRYLIEKEEDDLER